MIPPYNPAIDEKTFNSLVTDIEKILLSNEIDVTISRPEQLGLVLHFKDPQKIQNAISFLDVLINKRGYTCNCLEQKSDAVLLKFKEEDLLLKETPGDF